MSGQKRAGWAIIRYIPSGAGCPEPEIGGNTRDNWYSCCPAGETFDGEYNWNPYCNTDSTMGNTTKQCANSTWSLWWSTDYFCCEPDLAGYYWQSDGSVGCWDKDWILQAQNNNSGAYLANSATNPPGTWTLLTYL